MTRRSAFALFFALLLSVPTWAQFNTRDTGSAPGPNYIAEGTRFVVRLDDTLDTQKLQIGKKFKAKLAEDLMAPNGAIIPAGKKIKGHISDVDRGLHGRILMSFDEIETRNGWRPLVATVTDVPGEKGVKEPGPEGEIERQGRSTTRIVEAAAVGAGIGAIAGGAAGGGHGAAIGAAAGAGLGAGAGLLINSELKLNKGQQLELRLDRPLQVPF